MPRDKIHQSFTSKLFVSDSEFQKIPRNNNKHQLHNHTILFRNNLDPPHCRSHQAGQLLKGTPGTHRQDLRVWVEKHELRCCTILGNVETEEEWQWQWPLYPLSQTQPMLFSASQGSEYTLPAFAARCFWGQHDPLSLQLLGQMWRWQARPDIRTSYWDSSWVYICKSIVNDLRHGNYIFKKLPDIRTSYWDSSGVYICKSIVNDLRHGNYICKS